MLVALKGSAGPIRCAVAYYGPLDAYYKVSSPLALLKPSSLPVLVAKAGRDTPTINRSIDRFVAKSRRLGARVELLVHPTVRTSSTPRVTPAAARSSAGRSTSCAPVCAADAYDAAR